MVWHKDMKKVVEIFRIQTENFDLWAALISLENGKFTIRGGTRFQKGETCCFSSEISDRTSLRERLLSACRPIAAFYGAELVHRKIRRSGKEKVKGPFLVKAGQRVH